MPPPVESPRVAVVVPAFEAAATIGTTLDALAAQTVAAEVVVVDNGSSDATPRIAAAHPVVSRVLRSPRPGPAAGRNAGAAATSAPVLAFTDADCAPVPGWLEAGLGALRDADLLQGRVEPDPAARRTPFDRTLSVTAPWGLFESANLFVRREWFDRVGGFAEVAPGAERLVGTSAARPFGEDVLFGWAARRAGARTAFADAALVHHAVFARSAGEYVAERRRLRHFPGLVREVPELRRAFLRRRLFLTAQSMAFDAAAAGVALAAARRSPLPLVAALPYGLRLRRFARHWPAHPAPALVAVQVAADAVGAAALARGSLAARCAVL